MKVVILAGGFGTRFAEETEIKPKPMIEIGGFPIIWHIMKIFSSQGFEEFFVALGYKGEIFKRYFSDYNELSGNLTINLADGTSEISDTQHRENWTVNLINTGLNSMTGGRVKRLQKFIGDETFILTYGDGVADIDVKKLVEFHKSHGKIATVTAVRPPARYGELIFNADNTVRFNEKPQNRDSWINGGFMVFEPKIFDYLKNDESILEKDALEISADENQLVAFKHNGFWQCMDTLRDKRQLEELWQSGNPPWKIW